MSSAIGPKPPAVWQPTQRALRMGSTSVVHVTCDSRGCATGAQTRREPSPRPPPTDEHVNCTSRGCHLRQIVTSYCWFQLLRSRGVSRNESAPVQCACRADEQSSTRGRQKSRQVSRLRRRRCFCCSPRRPRAQVAIDVTVSRNITANSAIGDARRRSRLGSGNEVLLAFVATDYISGPNTTVTSVSGGGLTWVLVVRSNAQAGTSEIWRAFAPARLTNVDGHGDHLAGGHVVDHRDELHRCRHVRDQRLRRDRRHRQRNSSYGAPSASLVTTRNNSMVFGVGNDYDNAIARTLGTGQTLMHQYLTSVGDTYWVQRRTSPTPLAARAVTINDTAPTSDRYNLSICRSPSGDRGPQTWNMSGTVSPAAAGSGTYCSFPERCSRPPPTAPAISTSRACRTAPTR